MAIPDCVVTRTTSGQMTGTSLIANSAISHFLLHEEKFDDWFLLHMAFVSCFPSCSIIVETVVVFTATHALTTPCPCHPLPNLSGCVTLVRSCCWNVTVLRDKGFSLNWIFSVRLLPVFCMACWLGQIRYSTTNRITAFYSRLFFLCIYQQLCSYCIFKREQMYSLCMLLVNNSELHKQASQQVNPMRRWWTTWDVCAWHYACASIRKTGRAGAVTMLIH